MLKARQRAYTASQGVALPPRGRLPGLICLWRVGLQEARKRDNLAWQQGLPLPNALLSQ